MVAKKKGKIRRFNAGQIHQIKEAFGLTQKDINKLSNSQKRSVLRKLDSRDRPRARAEYARLIEADDFGHVPKNGIENALRQLDSARSRSLPKPANAGVPCGSAVVPRKLFAVPTLAPAAGVAVAAWKPIGPGNIGGRTRSIVVDPGDSNRIWVGSAGGGVWNSSDGGMSWAPVNDMMANLAISCMIMDPSSSNTIYAGTGEGFGNVDALRGAGIFRTTDQVNWQQLPNTNNINFHYVNRIAVSRNGNVIFAATGKSFAGDAPNRHGIYRSDDPDRNTWTRELVAEIGDIKCSPTDSRRAIAGSLRNGEAYFTTNGGLNWKKATHTGIWSGRIELAYSAKDSSIVYASMDRNGGEIWRSTDGGKSYTKRGSLNADGDPARFLGGQGWYDNTIWAGDPTDSKLVIVGGIDLWRSTNSGTLLKPISNWREGASAHADHHVILSDPHFDGTTNKSVYFGNDGGIYRTKNIRTVGNNVNSTNGWKNLVNGYAVTQFYSGVGNAQSGTIVGGAQDNGTLAITSSSPSQVWHEIQGGDGGYCAADQNDKKRFYGEYTFLSIFRNTDGATSDANWWENYINGRFFNQNLPQPGWDWKPIPFQIPDSRNERALFIAPFILDSNDSNRILAGGETLWRTNDAKKSNTDSKGPSWQSIKSSIGSRINISAIAIAQGSSKVVWVGYQNGEVARTANGTDAAPTWQIVGDHGPNQLEPHRVCTRIVVDPKNHSTVYATFGGYVANNVWKTTDNGANWSTIGSTLPEVPIRALAIHPSKSNFLYLGTDVGVFTSEDAGASWSPTNEGPTNCSVAELSWVGKTLLCATHGRGMFTIDLSTV